MNLNRRPIIYFGNIVYIYKAFYLSYKKFYGGKIFLTATLRLPLLNMKKKISPRVFAQQLPLIKLSSCYIPRTELKMINIDVDKSQI